MKYTVKRENSVFKWKDFSQTDFEKQDILDLSKIFTYLRNK